MNLRNKSLLLFVAAVAFGVGMAAVCGISWMQERLMPLSQNPSHRSAMTVPKFGFPVLPASESGSIETVATKTQQKEVVSFSPSGDFVLVDGLGSISITTTEYNQKLKKDVPVKPYGHLYRDGREFVFASIEINGNNIRFVTKKRKGVSFQFEGNLVNETVRAKGDDGEYQNPRVDLTGRLSKFLGGNLVDETKINASLWEVCGG